MSPANPIEGHIYHVENRAICFSFSCEQIGFVGHGCFINTWVLVFRLGGERGGLFCSCGNGICNTWGVIYRKLLRSFVAALVGVVPLCGMTLCTQRRNARRNLKLVGETPFGKVNLLKFPNFATRSFCFKENNWAKQAVKWNVTRAKQGKLFDTRENQLSLFYI